MKYYENGIKAGASALGALTAHYAEGLGQALVLLLIAFEAGDYITGIIAACKQRSLNSRDAFWGFIKKLCYFVLIGVAFGIDYLVAEVAVHIGLGVELPAFFGMLSVCYLLSTEGISILENLGELGIEVPFLSKFIHLVRNKIEEKGDKNGD
ncbi:MAG: phage holin family protein [Defluviitaleaceae bacterium]|nr:phage holin family protein [Defluviitaleaceae bacterium]MCL2835173.1 phage holin family protein [Defluviitaleaceae bacterium]